MSTGYLVRLRHDGKDLSLVFMRLPHVLICDSSFEDLIPSLP